MSENYTPGDNALPLPPYTTVFLSQRDAALRIPINFVTSPGVPLTAACFNGNRYDDDSSGDCLSNLLAVGFRRFIIDLYWDEGRDVWSFCPVSIPEDIANLVPLSTVTIFPSSTLSSSSSPTSSASSSPSSSATSTLLSRTGASLNARQTTASSTRSGLANPTESSLGDTLPSASPVADTSNQPLVSIGPYICTTTINISVFYTQLLDYIQKTENTLGAHLIYIILNIHASASTESPTSPAPKPVNLPSAVNSLGAQFLVNGSLSEYIYTESDLFSDRLNLNNSWYDVPDENYRPVEGYYQMERSENGILSTEDGWPSEGYIEFAKSKRLLLGWGTVDPQMEEYNFSGDSGTIFSNGFIQDIQTDINVTSNGELTSGCFFRNDTDDLARINSSWAIASTLSNFNYPVTASSDLTPLLNLTTSATTCGISHLLNSTLLNVSAHLNPAPYQAFSYASIWSWATDEPRNASSTSDTDSSIFRCAISNKDRAGRWVVDDCSQKRYAACRARSQPYNFTLTPVAVSYSFASENCPEDYDFAVPRTALENAYLTEAMRTTDRDWDGHGAWIDFNSLDIEGCWTTGGENATCPYKEQVQDMGSINRRVILVPVIAAIIVLILTGLLILVKCFGARNVRKRTRKRGGEALIYEGVPS